MIPRHQVPQQDNTVDCGVFLIYFAQAFMDNPELHLPPGKVNVTKFFAREVNAHFIYSPSVDYPTRIATQLENPISD